MFVRRKAREGVRLPRDGITVMQQCMKTTVTINRCGVITLPTKMRRALGLKPDDDLIIEMMPEGLLLRPAVTLPVEMYTPEREHEFGLWRPSLPPCSRARRRAPGTRPDPHAKWIAEHSNCQMRVFRDANLLFSAAKSDGALRALLRRLLEDRHECWVNDYVVIEARRNLDAKGPEALVTPETLLSRLRISPVRGPEPLLEGLG